jgi:hypothetical protein
MWSTPFTLRLSLCGAGRLLVAAHPALERLAVRADGVTVDEHQRSVVGDPGRHVVAVLGVQELPAHTGVDLDGRGRVGGDGDERCGHGGREHDEAHDELPQMILLVSGTPTRLS